ncbi:calcium-binding protein [Histidinibacterium lentulum]|uniref:Calcium-binding protein n=1 Tax=Histidinibacterium lentulum TaxID=2480588 RepID=A0A3N2QWF0_9RHOB|nr:calcium-binding protein [Histidinibacterium lentulum]ROT99487.1 calcium-binding protein [Histidinibacterium lentulum]
MAVLTEIVPELQANTGAAATGTQSSPKIIGLSNGNTLVAWVEGSTQGIANPPPGTDIIGVIYDADGAVLRDAFRLNTARFADNERDFDIAATNDGGFVMAYMDDDTNNIRTDVMWERYNSNGDLINNAVIRTEVSNTDDLRNPSVTVNLDTNDTFVTYTFDTGVERIFGKLVSATGTVGPERSVAQNVGGSNNRDADVATLANGNMVVAYEEQDGAIYEIEYQIISATGVKIGSFREVDGPPGTQTDPNVAGLANGDFVITWQQNFDIWFQVFQPNGLPRGPAAQANTSTTSEIGPDVKALPDGGFVIAWDSGTGTTRARNFDADGTPRGPETAVSGTGNISDVDVDVTSEGVSLFVYRLNGEIFATAWDGRADTLDMADVQGGLPNFLTDEGSFTGHPTGSTIIGTDGNDEIYGRGGSDSIIGGLGFDTIYGGRGFDEISGLGGFDEIYGEGGNDTLFGNAGNDTIFGGGGNDTIDGGIGADLINGGIGFDVVFGKGGNDTIAGLEGFDTLSGNNGNDSIQGNAGNDVIFGGLGNDTIDGGIGADTLYGDAGADLIAGKAGFDVIYGGNGTDTLYGNAGNDTLFGGLGDDVLFGGIGSDTFVFVVTPGERDTIADFEVGRDRLLIDAPPGTTLDDLEIRAVAGGAEATALGHTIFFAGLTVAQVQEIDAILI